MIGTNKHESRRIDNQLRGRAGRQGDPGTSRFFISLEDDLMVRYGSLDERYRDDPDTLQRLIEGQTLDTRVFLHGYEVPFEGQRNIICTRRQQILESAMPEPEKRVAPHHVDDRWADPPGARLRVSLRRALGLLGRPRFPSCSTCSGSTSGSAKWRLRLPAEIARRVESGGAEMPDRGAVLDLPDHGTSPSAAGNANSSAACPMRSWPLGDWVRYSVEPIRAATVRERLRHSWPPKHAWPWWPQRL